MTIDIARVVPHFFDTVVKCIKEVNSNDLLKFNTTEPQVYLKGVMFDVHNLASLPSTSEISTPCIILVDTIGLEAICNSHEWTCSLNIEDSNRSDFIGRVASIAGCVFVCAELPDNITSVVLKPQWEILND